MISIKEINKLALPAIISGISEPLISLVDTAIIGKLGTIQLGGVGVAASLVTLLIWILSQTKSAISSIVSQYLGKNQIEQIKSLIPQVLTFNSVLGIGCIMILLPLSKNALALYEAKGELLLVANEYLLIRLWGIPITLITFTLFGVFRGMQNTHFAMYVSLIGGFVNLVLDIILVFGIDGVIPAFGVEGAAVASLIAQFVMMIIAIYLTTKKMKFPILKFNKKHKELNRYIGMSLNLFARAFALNLAFYLGTRMATSYGNAEVAAYTIGINIWLFSSFFIDGYSNAGNAMAGKIIGTGDKKLLYNLGKKLVGINVGIGGLLSLSYLIVYPFIANWFSMDKVVISLFNSVFWIIIISQPINAVAFTLDGIFKGLGKTKLLRNVLLGSSLFVFIPIIFIGDYLYPSLFIIWIAFVGWMIGRSIPLIFVFRNQYSH